MGQRTIPDAIEQAHMVARLAPQAWLINFTNPAGLVTQAVLQHTAAKAVGICDTPTEMLHRIRMALRASASEVECEYIGLNHLGWIRKIRLHGKDVTDALLQDDRLLSQLYPAPLFNHELIRALRLLPTEYLSFYYSRTRALKNQIRQGATRGEEINRMNEIFMAKLMDLLGRYEDAEALREYVNYLNLRFGSYMKLEGEGRSAFDGQIEHADPFRADTGYHRIALEVVIALCSQQTHRAIVNVQNRGTLADIDAKDAIETFCEIGNETIRPISVEPYRMSFAVLSLP